MEAEKRNPYLPEEYTPTVVFQDGTELEGTGSRNEVMDEVWYWFDDSKYTIPGLTMIFSDPEKTQHVTVNATAKEQLHYDGYTDLATIMHEKLAKEIRVRMKKP